MSGERSSHFFRSVLRVCVFLALSSLSTSAAAASTRPTAELIVDLDLSEGAGRHTEALLLDGAQELALEGSPAKATRQLRAGDRLRLRDGQAGVVLRISKYTGKPSGSGRVVGKSRHLVTELLRLQTSAELIDTTPQHPFYVVRESGGSWTEAGDLRQGDRIATTKPGRLAEVVATRIVSVAPTPVYNMLIEGTPVYHVGSEGLLVHNGICTPLPEGFRILEGPFVQEFMDNGVLKTRQFAVFQPPDQRPQMWYQSSGRNSGVTDAWFPLDPYLGVNASSHPILGRMNQYRAGYVNKPRLRDMQFGSLDIVNDYLKPYESQEYSKRYGAGKDVPPALMAKWIRDDHYWNREGGPIFEDNFALLNPNGVGIVLDPVGQHDHKTFNAKARAAGVLTLKDGW